MATRKTASKTAATPAGKTANKAKSKPEATTRTRAAPAAKAPDVKAPAKPAPLPASGRALPESPDKPVAMPTGEARYRWIAHAAYLRAEKRGFAPGHEIDDWLAAEADFLAAHAAPL